MTQETMTSRERVIRTLNRQPVDRMPIDLGSHTSTGISMFAYWNLRKYLGLSTDNIHVHDMVQSLASVDMDVLQRFHCDCISLEPAYQHTARWNPRGKYQFIIPADANPRQEDDGRWIIKQDDLFMVMPKDGYFFDGAWLNNWGRGSEEERLELYAKEAERIFKETSYAINFIGYSHGMGMHGYGGGVIEDAIMAYDDPQTLHQKREAALTASIERMGKVIDRFGEYIQMVSMSDDMGTQNGPMCSPKYVEEFAIPYYRRFCEFVHTHSDIKVFLHSCGSIRFAIPMLIDAGIDVLNPVQISAENMDPQELKNEFGDRICFWGGGCNTQGVLGVGDVQAVKDNVRELVNIFKADGGFVFNQVHNIMGNVRPENIVAMLDTAYEESFYCNEKPTRSD